MEENEKRGSAKSFQDLIVWQKAHEFVLAIYKMSQSFLGEERFGLTSQLRHAAVSIPANIEQTELWNLSAEIARLLNAYRTAILKDRS